MRRGQGQAWEDFLRGVIIRYKWCVNHLYWDLGECATGALFEIGLRGSTARVCLMDGDEYQAYVDGDEYEFFGGFYDLTPVVLEVPYDDHWWLIVDSNPDRIRITVNQVFN